MSHLNFVDRVVHFLAPHRDAVLTVGAGPAVLAETLRLEAGERPVVRDTHGTLSRHGRGSRTPRHGMGRGGTHTRRALQGPETQGQTVDTRQQMQPLLPVAALPRYLPNPILLPVGSWFFFFFAGCVL